MPKITEMENKFSSIQESDEDDRFSENNSAPYVVVSCEQLWNDKKQTL